MIKVITKNGEIELMPGTRIENGIGDVKKLPLSNRPLAVTVNGRVKRLSVVPEDGREATLMYYGDEIGRRVYERSLKLVFLYALKRLYVGTTAEERYSLGDGVFITVDKEMTENDIADIKNECKKIIAEDIKIISEGGICRIGSCAERRSGVMLPSTGYLSEFDIKWIDGGILLLLPPMKEFYPKKLVATLRIDEERCRQFNVQTAEDLNKIVSSGQLGELIRLSEAFHERTYIETANRIAEGGHRAVMVAGPSASGKTTSAYRIATQLKIAGLKPIMLSLDNYYIDREEIIKNNGGKVDFEHINTLDIDRFTDDLEALLNGKAVETPVFDFETGKRKKNGIVLKADEKCPLIIEGIHGLNPLMLSSSVDDSKVFRIYVSALTTLNIDAHNRIHTSDVRLLRRLVRDYHMRGASMEQTLSMWQTVRNGEERWIFPYQEKSDVIINSSHVYELAFLKNYVYNLLTEMTEQSPYYPIASELIAFLSYFEAASKKDEAHIPPSAVLREFIGGNTYYI